MITITMQLKKTNEPPSVQKLRLETLPLEDAGPLAIGLRRQGPPVVTVLDDAVQIVLTLDELPVFLASFPTPTLREQAAKSLYPSEISLRANAVVLSTALRLS